MEGRETIRSDRCGNFAAALGIFRPPAIHREGDWQKGLVFLFSFFSLFFLSLPSSAEEMQRKAYFDCGPSDNQGFHA